MYNSKVLTTLKNNKSTVDSLGLVKMVIEKYFKNNESLATAFVKFIQNMVGIILQL